MYAEELPAMIPTVSKTIFSFEAASCLARSVNNTTACHPCGPIFGAASGAKRLSLRVRTLSETLLYCVFVARWKVKFMLRALGKVGSSKKTALGGEHPT
jgi:hypothetical protein